MIPGGSNRPGLSDEYTIEWRSLSTCRHNALLEGPPAAITAALWSLEPDLLKPIRWPKPRTPLVLPADEYGTLVLQDVATLNADAQQQVSRWLDDGGDRKQTIATTTVPLFPLVADGLFDETLYYRLNVVLLRIESSDRPEHA